ncbi:MAG: hypothetical protein GY906_06020 [bacterium]|nr:hypothetical protein [bacterium]
MCRLLLVSSRNGFALRPVLESFSEMCRNSREYQGDGWGVLHRSGLSSSVHRSVEPIWTSNFAEFRTANLVLAHARSAFRNDPPSLAHTMPFISGDIGFAFNGELHGVRLRSQGSNGAQKIFSLADRLIRSDPERGFQRAITAIRNHTDHIRALNIVMTDVKRIYFSTTFSQEPDYFSLHIKRSSDMIAICSEPLPDDQEWTPVPNNTMEVLQCC